MTFLPINDERIETFHALCRNGTVDEMRAMLAQTPELLEAMDSENLTPLCSVLTLGVPLFDAAQKAKLLLEWGADMNGRSYQDGNPGFTPLMQAALCGQTLATRLLLDEGADTTLKDDDGYTALVHARLPLLEAQATRDIISDMIEKEPLRRITERQRLEQARNKEITDFHTGLEQALRLPAPRPLPLQPRKRKPER